MNCFREVIRTEPGEVEGNLLSKVLPDVIQRLILVPFAPAGPVVVKNLPLVQLIGTSFIFWELKGALRKTVSAVSVKEHK